MRNDQIEIESLLASPRLSPWRVFWIYTTIGAQSFGGGSATLYLIRRVSVDRYGWLTDEEFIRYWGICQIAPGINILGLVILIGWRVGGAFGSAAALTGLLLPSATITVALTSIYAGVRNLPIVKAAIAGVVPATVGLGVLLAYTMARPLLSGARREGYVSTIFAVTLLLISMVAALKHAPVLAILWGAGGLSAIAQWQRAAGRERLR
jgi:chromate transporter